MSTKNTNAHVLLEDLKVSFKFALKNLISFILGMFGVLIVTGLLIAVLAVLIIVPVFLTGGLMLLIDGITAWITATQSLAGAAAFLMILLLMTPVFAPLLVAVGALYGMAREIVESEGTTAEGVFSWYSKKFFPLAAAGIFQFLIIIAPMALGVAILGPTSFSFGPEQVAIASMVIGFYAVYVAVVSGLMSMIFPAIIDGKSVIDAIRTSIKLSTTYFDRVFSVWLSYLGILLVLLIPILLPAIMAFPTMPDSPVIMAALSFFATYGTFVGLFIAFVLFPAVVIGMSRIYMILISDNLTEHGENLGDFPDDVHFVGGD